MYSSWRAPQQKPNDQISNGKWYLAQTLSKWGFFLPSREREKAQAHISKDRLRISKSLLESWLGVLRTLPDGILSMDARFPALIFSMGVLVVFFFWAGKKRLFFCEREIFGLGGEEEEEEEHLGASSSHAV